ncbi:MAG: A/G-specific adenine glycosylase [Clostridia bacterium]|nr:A/G-specific adenine glycosylase [Clostridia bacterium]
MQKNVLLSAVDPLCDWYEKNKKQYPWREKRDAYRIWISEVMLQQTRTAAVIPYYERFLSAFPTVEALASAPDDLLMKLWEGLGYYSRARNLKKGAIQIMERFGGALPKTKAELKTIAGIGDYTAGAIASMAFFEPASAVDGNVLRVCMRLLGSDADISKEQTKRALAAMLDAVYPAGERAALFTEGLMELGEAVCIPGGEARCALCPLTELCEARAGGITHLLPAKSAKKPRKILEKTLFIFQCGDRFGIRKRQESGLLAGLYEFPAEEAALSEKEASALLCSRGIAFSSLTPLGGATHIFTHLEWRMTGYLVTLEKEIDGLIFATREALSAVYALPSAFRFFKKAIEP